MEFDRIHNPTGHTETAEIEYEDEEEYEADAVEETYVED